jgi:hypothetical protein
VQRTYDLLRRHALRVEPAEWFGAGNLVIRRAVFAELGGFDTTLESCEDVELCFRLQASGALMLAVPALYSTHHGDPTTLGRLFVAELWRGRDNLRVSLRGPRSFSNFASATLPLGMLGAAGVALVGALTLTPQGLLLALVAVAGIVGIILLRAAAMVRRLDRVSVVAVVQAVVVAAVYEAARAAAIVLRASHHRRHDRVPVGA